MTRRYVITLQWGHRLSAMEMRCQRLVREVMEEASMGPPPFGDGNCYLLLNSVDIERNGVIFAVFGDTNRHRSDSIQRKRPGS